jgi:hypothetical protein
LRSQHSGADWVSIVEHVTLPRTYRFAVTASRRVKPDKTPPRHAKPPDQKTRTCQALQESVSNRRAKLLKT